jgi:hypothetical protein
MRVRVRTAGAHLEMITHVRNDRYTQRAQPLAELSRVIVGMYCSRRATPTGVSCTFGEPAFVQVPEVLIGRRIVNVGRNVEHLRRGSKRDFGARQARCKRPQRSLDRLLASVAADEAERPLANRAIERRTIEEWRIRGAETIACSRCRSKWGDALREFQSPDARGVVLYMHIV